MGIQAPMLPGLRFDPKPRHPEAAKRGALAAQACADAADRRIPGWVEKAYNAFVLYAKFNGPSRQFTTEDVRLGVSGVPEAPDGRAWGAVAQRMKREGLIKPVGFRCVASSNNSPKTLWQSTITP